ncbi:MAG: D-alanine--D-alanine ligase [Desulfobacterales bacterium]
MRIAIAHNALRAGAGPEEQDVLVQVAAVEGALRELGHASLRLACDLDLERFRRRLAEAAPDLVFNLVESLDGRGCLIHWVPELLEALGVPFTGSPAEAVRTTSHKVLAKERLVLLGLPTPPWIDPVPAGPPRVAPSAPPADREQGPWLIKSLWEHASIGLDERRLPLCGRADEARGELLRRAPALGGSCFAERFIPGREFNLSLLGGEGGPQVLAPAEILFEGYPADAPAVVGYRAKWVPDSFEFLHTPRRFAFPAAEATLLARLSGLARDCWRGFGLKGWARVDFRVDGRGDPWILEVNANPCLAPDAGFAAALEASGIAFSEAVGRILEDALRGEAGGATSAVDCRSPCP